MKLLQTSTVLANTAHGMLNQITKPLIYGECGGNYAGVRGHIASPGFPFNDYPPEQDCEWVIEVPTNLYVEIDVVWMDLEADPAGCRFDALTIKAQDGHQLLQRSCGDNKPFPTVVNDSRVIIRFKSDEREEKSGFALNWKAVEPPRDSFDCDFERGYCHGWSNDPQDDFIWQLNRGQTQTIGTGPGTDHTTAGLDGVYAYIEGSLPNLPGEKAGLISPVVPISKQPRCLSFWYHMQGNGVGQLAVYRQSESNETIIFEKTKNQGTEWIEARIDLGPIDFNSRIKFVGTVGKRFESDIAIDDISMTLGSCTTEPEGLCGDNEYMCASGKNCIPNEYLCDGTTDCEDNDDELMCRNSFPHDDNPHRESEKVTNLSGNSTLEVHQHESIQSKTSHCGNDEYQCAGNNGCVPIGWLCDGQPDCQNGDDENGCPVKLQRFYDRLKVNDKMTTLSPATVEEQTTDQMNVTDFTTQQLMSEITTQSVDQEILVTSSFEMGQANDSPDIQENKQHDFYQTTEQPSLDLELNSEIDIIIEIKHPKSVIYAADKVQSDSAKLMLVSLFLMLCLL